MGSDDVGDDDVGYVAVACSTPLQFTPVFVKVVKSLL